MASDIRDQLASLRLRRDIEADDGSYGRSYESSSSVDSSYTRRGQHESESEIRAGLAAARDLASRRRKIDVDSLGSASHARRTSDAGVDNNEEDSLTNGTKTPISDGSESWYRRDRVSILKFALQTV